MPTQKDLKRLVRSRMQKTGEAYTAARFQPHQESTQARLRESRGHERRRRAQADRPHVGGVGARAGRGGRRRETSRTRSPSTFASLGTPSWWTQMVTVGDERIRGLREKGQRRDGGYEASKSRTFNVPVETLFDAFANARTRRTWLPVKITVRSATPLRRMRIAWEDDTPVQVGFTPKGTAKSVVAIQHEKLPDKSAAAAMKAAWSGHFDRLGEMLS